MRHNLVGGTQDIDGIQRARPDSRARQRPPSLSDPCDQDERVEPGGADGLHATISPVRCQPNAKAPALASSRAGGITSIPSLRNCQAVTLCPSRRRAVSHRMVASEPVTDRFGPRSTPISTALRT